MFESLCDEYVSKYIIKKNTCLISSFATYDTRRVSVSNMDNIELNYPKKYGNQMKYIRYREVIAIFLTLIIPSNGIKLPTTVNPDEHRLRYWCFKANLIPFENIKIVLDSKPISCKIASNIF